MPNSTPRRRKKLLVVIYSLGQGGAQRVVARLTQEWAKSHDVLIVLTRRERARHIFDYGGRLTSIESAETNRILINTVRGKIGRILLFWERVRLLRAIILSERPDRIFSFMENANFPTVMACLFSCQLSRLWVSVHTVPSRIFPRRRRKMPFLYRLPNRIVVVSKGVKHELETMGLPTERIIVIPNPVAFRK